MTGDGATHADVFVAPDGSGNGYTSRLTGLEFRYGELKQDVGELKNQLAAGFNSLSSDIRQNRERYDIRMEAISSSLAERGRTNWPVILGCGIGMFGMITTLVSAGYYVTSQQTQLLATPLAIRAEVFAASMTALQKRVEGFEGGARDVDRALQTNEARDSRSEQDRADSKQRIDRLADAQSVIQSRLSALESDTGEKNTQLCAIERMQNVVAAYQARLDGELWDETHEHPLPPMPAFPVGLSCAPRS